MRDISRISSLLLGLLCALAWSTITPATDRKHLLILDAEGQPLLEPIEMIGTVIIRPDGTLEVSTDQPLACGAELDCPDVQVGTLTFSATATAAEIGTSIDFSWKSAGAWECRAGGTLSGWRDRTGLPPDSRDASLAQRRVSTSGLDAGTYIATLLCSNGPVESDAGVPRQLSIALSEPPPPAADLPAFCNDADRRPPPDWIRMSTGSLSCRFLGGWIAGADCREWDKTFSAPFNPNGTGETIGMGPRIPSGRSYIAMRFNSGDIQPGQRGEFVVNITSGLQSRRKLISLSQCPGDFNQEAILDRANGGTGCIIESLIDNLRWGTDGDTGRACQLQPNTQYFFNIVYTNTALPGVTWADIQPHPDCANGVLCGNLFRNIRASDAP